MPTYAEKEAFVQALLAHGTLMAACEAVGITRYALRAWRDEDPVFAGEVQAAQDMLAQQAGLLMAPDQTPEVPDVPEAEPEPAPVPEPAPELYSPALRACLDTLMQTIRADAVYARNLRVRLATWQGSDEGPLTKLIDAIRGD